MADRDIKIIIDLQDNTGGKLGGLKSSLAALDKTAARLSEKFKTFAASSYNATVRLIDRVSEPGSRINALLKRLAAGTYNITMRLNDGALNKIRTIESALMRLSSKVVNVAINVKGAAGQKLSNLTGGLLTGAGIFAPAAGMAGVGFGVSNAIQSYAAFEKQMSKVQAVRQLDKNSDDMKLLASQAKELGKTTAWTRREVAEAQYYEALAGWQTPQILASTPHILNLASAADLSAKQASDIVTDNLTAFGLKATDEYIDSQGKATNVVQMYADRLAKLQASSNTDVLQAAEAFKYSANQFGVMSANLTDREKIQRAMDTATDAMVMVGLQANAGIKGSMAGTGLSNIMQRMASGNRNAYYALGLTDTQIEDADHNLYSPEKIMKQINRAYHQGLDIEKLANFVEDMTGEKIHADTRRKLDKLSRDALENGGKLGTADMMQLGTMFAGSEHSHKLMAIMMGDWDEMEAKLVNSQGAAADMSQTMLDNLSGAFTYLGSAWDNFQQNLMEGTAGDGLKNFVQTLTDMINRADALFADGIDLTDIGKIIADAVSRLKSKFMELDGLGSILAGGVLFGSLVKLISFMRSLTSTIRGAGKGISSAQTVASMNVTAGVVNVNGKIGVGSRNVGNRAIIDNYNRTKEQIRGTPPPAPSRFDGMKSAAGYGAALSAVFAGLDVFAGRAANAERLAAATPENREQILRENRRSEWETSVGALGMVAGSALGAALGSIAGPLGTAIGSVIGGTIGEYLGIKAGSEGADAEEARNQNAFAAPNVGSSWADFKRAQDSDSDAVLRTLHSVQARRKRDDERELEMIENMRRTDEKYAGLDAWFKSNHLELFNPNMTSAESAALDYWNQQRDFMNRGFYGGDFSIGSRAEAAELNAEQTAQMEAMERGEFFPYASNTPNLSNETDYSFITEDLYSQIESMQEGINELFAGMGDMISENLSAALESASQVFDGFGETITEGLTFALESGSEIFANFGETISNGLLSAQEAATSALEAIALSFSSAKDFIQNSWAELPGFFGGIFAGLGGAAESAGAAIYAGLTSPIGAVVGAWESAAAQISAIISSISAQAAAVPSIGGGVGKAEGGLVAAETHFFAGEHGPEMVIPLSDRTRGLDLLDQTAAILGVKRNEETFDLPSNESESGFVSSMNMGGIVMNVSFEIKSSEPTDVMSEIREHLNELREQMAGELSKSLSDCFYNQMLEV